MSGFLALWLPHLLRGELLYPHDNGPEVGAEIRAHSGASRLFADQTNLYVPEFEAYGSIPHEAPIPTWNPHNSLGRPMTPSGLGGAFALNHAIAWASTDPLWRYTLWALLSVVGTAIFAFGFLMALGLTPLAAALSSLGISIGPIFGAWQIVPLIQWGFCWAFAGLWAVERFLLRPGPAPLVGLALAVHLEVLTGFPQHALLMGWAVGTWTVWRVFETQASGRQSARRAAALGVAIGLGLLSLTPVLRDLWADWSESSRRGHSMQTVSSDTNSVELMRFLAGLVAATWDDRYAARSVSLTPLFAGLATLGVLARRRRADWSWSLWAGAILLASAWRPASSALRSLGIAFSEWPHIYAGQLPLAILAAIGADLALSPGRPRRSVRLAAVGLPLLALLVGAAGSRLEPDPTAAAWTAVTALLALAFAWRPSHWLLTLTALTALASESEAQVRWRLPADIQRDSPLAEALRAQTSDGSRFAWLGPRPDGDRFLPPNQELMLGLTSVHGYDHLVGERFQDWAERFADSKYRASDFQRRFLEVTEIERFLKGTVDTAAVSVVASLAPFEHARLTPLGRFGPIWLQTVREPAPQQALLPAACYQLKGDGLRLEAPSVVRAGLALERLPTKGVDHLAFAFEPQAEEQLLFVSQQHHRDWKARGPLGPLKTLPVDGVFEGVLVPPGCGHVELRFERWIGYSLWVQAAFACIAVAALLWPQSRRARQPEAPGYPPPR